MHGRSSRVDFPTPTIMVKSNTDSSISDVASGELSLSEVLEARRLFKRFWPITRLVEAESLSRLTGKTVYLKLENDLPTGSFKPRGALYALSTNRTKGVREVVAFSTGNHGIAVAYSAHLLNINATIVLPHNANPVKRQKILRLGAKLIEHGRNSYEASIVAKQYARDHGAYLLDDITNRHIVVGSATIASEILDQAPSVDAVISPIGDSSLIRGIAGMMQLMAPGVKTIGVQPKNAPTYYEAWKKGLPTDIRLRKTMADGLSTPKADLENVRVLSHCVHDIVLVSEQQMLSAVRHLLIEEHVVSEPAGAASTAAVVALNSTEFQNIVLIVSGANISPEVLRLALRTTGNTLKKS